MRFGKTLCLTLSILLLTVAAVPAVDRAVARPGSDLDQLEIDSQGQAHVVADPATGAPNLIVIPSGALELRGAGSQEKAQQFLVRYGAAFGLENPGRDLVAGESRGDNLGMTHLRFTQTYQGLPVFAADLRFHFNAGNQLVAVNGTVVPNLDLDPTPLVDMIEASDIARRVVAKDHGRTAIDLESTPPELMIYRTGLARGIPGTDHLVWKMEVGDGAGIREDVFVDAHRGFVVDRINGIHEINRAIHHRTYPSSSIWKEGDALPFSGATFSTQQNSEVNDLIDVAGETYDLFSNITNGEWLSYNGNDRQMISVYEATSFDPPCSESLNANWNGRNTNFCGGLAVDDVIAHEWTHAYTDYTHNLIYAWQPGALNESYSDIFGEIVDQTNGHGLDTPDTKRTAGGCSTFSGTPYPHLTVASPSSIAGDYEARGAQFNPNAPWSESAFVELVDDGTGTASDACEPLQGFTSGRIALIDRGDCPFVDKCTNAANAGASGIIIANNDGDGLVLMGGTQPASYDTPAIFVSQTTGEALKAALGEGVQATIALDLAGDNSVRWLVSEDGAGGAFRDMWNPNCMSNPGRVSDSAYYCLEDDSGGVHFNSGVPNHAFALMVDGGTYNSVTVTAIGMTRAAHIYWRAMREYQVPTTKFADHADALEISCNDLVNQTLTDLVTGQTVSQVVRNSDCNQVAAAVLATELRLAPTQCGFSTILEPDPPVLGADNVVYSETFDSAAALADWTLTNEGVEPEYDTARNWTVSTFLPAGRDGGALYAIDSPFVGDCQDDDQSGVLMAESPVIHLPASATSLYVVLDHYVATEPGWDGGNIKLSVNGGEFELVPASAFAFNPYNDAIILSTTDDEQNEIPNPNPLAGEPAYTGADEGSVEGSWGQTQIDLEILALPGDSVRFRFDFGNDGCSGAEGWYISTLQVVAGGQPTMSVLRPSRRISP
jgi:Zn-dependent metalloprotease